MKKLLIGTFVALPLLCSAQSKRKSTDVQRQETMKISKAPTAPVGTASAEQAKATLHPKWQVVNNTVIGEDSKAAHPTLQSRR